MKTNDPRDSFFDDKQTALAEHRRIIRQGGKAYCRRYTLKGKAVYRLRVQKSRGVVEPKAPAVTTRDA